MDDHRAESFARGVGGRLQARGEANQGVGQAQGRWGQVVDAVRDFTADQPFVALLTAAGLGAVVGFLTPRR